MQTNDDTQTIFLRGLRVDAEIGVFPHEKNRTQPLKLDADISVSDSKFHPTRDKLAEVFDYQRIRDALIDVVKNGHIHLLETLAERAIERLLALPDVRAVRLRITKFTAFEDCDSVGVEVFRRRAS
ncbi:MAG TPA: dihydroneopterin aldolase [Burkholderiaceae bacterium]|jgi:7,8-dihydroneopterin aldolase/epimerase/oxygenase|nr:dihydroneopterin aldolase [Burkholderiaceae bacterium]